MNKSPSNQTKPEPETGDDARIGRTFRWLVLVCVVLALAIGGVAWWRSRPPARPPAQTTPGTAPENPSKGVAEIPGAQFTDITAAGGISFVHENGAYGDKLLPETMGGGVAFFDFDNDGDQDLLFINSARWPWQAASDGGKLRAMALYRNDGKGRFDDVTAGSGLDVSFYGMGVAVGDYDNDGLPDVLITGVGGNRLFHNLGAGKFADVTSAAGVGGSTNDWSTSARSSCSGGIDGRPMSEYILVKRGDRSANTRSVIARIARSGWSARTRCSGDR